MDFLPHSPVAEGDPDSPESLPQDLWSSILDSVSSSRSIPSKNVLVLGKPGSGKSTITAALLGKPSPTISNGDGTDFALGYDWTDVRDDGDEDTLARLSVYTVPSSTTPFASLVPSFLPPKTALGHTTVMVVLDWTKPWDFVEELEVWLGWVEKWVHGLAVPNTNPKDGKDTKTLKEDGRELEVLREESRERWQSYLQHYTEPSSDPSIATSSSSTTLSNATVLPLGPGTLTHNSAGIPIIVVCTKADLIDENAQGAGVGGMGGTMGPTGAGSITGGMVKGKGGEWEEKTDGIMQILRTICLKYGAGLFYTTPLPETLSVLRQYTLHTLFVPPAPSVSSQINGDLANPSANPSSNPVRNPFPFLHRPNTLDRDRVVVPAGWDSWGKITVLREFDPGVWGGGWERDLESMDGGRDEDSSSDGAKKMYAALVPDGGVKAPPLPPFSSPTPEQAFLAKHYDETQNNRKAEREAGAGAPGAGPAGRERDPRGVFTRGGNQYGDGYEGGVYGNGPGIVGPMGSNSFSLPNVEKLFMEMESGAGASLNGSGSFSSSSAANTFGTSSLSTSTSSDRGLSDRTDRLDRTGRARPSTNRPANLLSPTGTGTSPPGSSSSSHAALMAALGGVGGRGPTSPSLPLSPGGGGSPTSASSGGGQTQHEVLQNFFQSLLSSKDRPGSAGSGGRERKKSTMSNGSVGGGEE
ncbi:hypothetical protein GYMLUDRAFT_40961 [Collybiopsis luxurians FD-317 M1]|uniref:Dynein light intermediate chain n=1 Tax=Collybiopsis luxurians FD-317 M1 TaxID=944289 RepID=A0A0D0D3L2_9AGAR|nr:hypothetical protein GYMLUDRAFT_40961 [Collybiopsis luxurians FD-317 M1]